MKARIIEIYGPSNEYFTTCHADYIDDFEDCAVYMAETTITPSPEILIKVSILEQCILLIKYRCI